ncbi:tetratricopeptide repeat protein [Bacteroides timonensis]|uniref:tetratricopeptide repeat protein n=1 Tax=Bacteroides timonensis TaxID=1470345 RepID=UPI0005C4A768|nr:tetratricopeptide repeat protein [Bacteroides timonensis]
MDLNAYKLENRSMGYVFMCKKLLILSIFFLFSLSLTAGETAARPAASIHYMDSIYVTRPRLALQMLDSLRRWSDANGYHAPATRSYVNLVSCLASMVADQLRPARHYGQETVAAARAEGNPEREMLAIVQLCAISGYLGDDEALGYWAQELEKRNVQTLNSPWYKAYSSLFYANALRMRGERSEAWKYLQKLIQSLDQLEKCVNMKVEVIPEAAILLGEMNRHDEAIALLEQAVRDTEQTELSPILDEQGRALILMNYYECLMVQYLASGRAQQADRCYRLYSQLSARYPGMEVRCRLPGQYLMQAHRYADAEAYARGCLDRQLQHPDSISEITKTAVTLLADACLAQGKKAEAATLYRRALVLGDSLAMRERRQAYMEYSLMSEVSSYEDTIRRQKSELQLHQTTLAVSGILAFMVLVTICMGMRQMRRQRRFNRELREENRLKQQAEDELARLKELMQDRTLSTVTATAPAENTPEDIILSLKELDEWLTEENRFAQPDMDIEKAAQHSGVSKRELAERCMKYKEKPFNEYLAELRLAYSCQRLTDDDFPTIETVAQESGFASVST